MLLQALLVFVGSGPWPGDTHPRTLLHQLRDRLPAAAPTVARTDLRVATSRDGLAFASRGVLFLAAAAAPDLIRLPGGELLAVFDCAAPDAPDDPAVMMFSRSRDEGRSWTVPQPVDLRDRAGRRLRGQHGDLVEFPAGDVGLFFALPRTRAPTSPGRQPSTAVTAALLQRGAEFRVLPDLRLGFEGGPDLHPTACLLDGQIHLYAAGLTRPRAAFGTQKEDAAHVCSSDGRKFVRLAPVRAADTHWVGNIIPVEGGLRAYATGPDGIRSLRSYDGRQWEPEAGIRMRDAWDPAVVQRRDGSYLMIYCTARRARPGNGTAPDAAEAGVQPRAGQDGQERGLVPQPSADLAKAYAAAAARDAATQNAESATADPWDTTATTAGGTAAVAMGAGADAPLFPPAPDFETPIDYVQWHEDHVASQVEDNAYDFYADHIPGFRWTGANAPPWVTPANPFSDPANATPFAPWDPADHPEWEAANQSIQGLLEVFRDARVHADYRYPAQWADSTDAANPDPPLLGEMVLPHLRPHRDLARATLADAWRLRDGAVSGEQMLDATETVLRNAGHLLQGPILIERLVGLAELGLAEANTRWALQQGVFSPEQMQETLDLFEQYDHGEPDPLTPLQGESAFAMEVTQYLFEPSSGAHVDARRAERVGRLLMYGNDDSAATWAARLAGLTRADADATVSAFQAYYGELADLWGTGYPTVRAADLDGLAERYRHTNALTESILPALSGVHRTRASSEASRRATRLACALQLFKAREGRWPASLDELPEHDTADSRTDPFTGFDLVYRLTDTGPTLYSLGENAADDGGLRAAPGSPSDAADDRLYWPPQP